jgi:hypothetical protein
MIAARATRPAVLLPLVAQGGAVVWLLLMVVLPVTMAGRLFLAGPLLFVPLMLLTLPERRLIGAVTSRDLGPWAFITAGPLAAALSLPPGPTAAALAGGFIAVTALVGLAALRDGLAALPALFGRDRTRDLATDGAFGFLAIGGLFLLADRLGIVVAGFGAPYTLMGAIHYTFLGFGLLGFVALMTTAPVARRHQLAVLALIGGVALTAVGMILGQPLINWLAVLGLALGAGPMVAWSLVSVARRAGRARRWLLFGAAGGLSAGLALGLGWASAALFGFEFIGLETMVRTHGVVNALSVIGAALALTLTPRSVRTP